jgi:transcription initiation factor IIF auxiliary subunit
MRVVLLHADTKQEIDADIFESVTYVLHESFGDKARQGGQMLPLDIYNPTLMHIASPQETTVPCL